MLAGFFSKLKTKTNLLRKSIQEKDPSKIGFFIAVEFFLFYILFSLTKLFIILFNRPNDSFQLLLEKPAGISRPYMKTYSYSYEEYRVFQKRVKRYTALGVVLFGAILCFSLWKTIAAEKDIDEKTAVYNVRIDNVTRTTASVSWNTIKKSTGYIEYGKTLNYDVKNYEDDDNPKEDHSVILVNLQPNSTYHFRISGVYQNSKLIYSEDYTVSTLPFLEITNERIKKITNDSARVSFETSVPASVYVIYQPADKSADESAIIDPESGLFEIIEEVALKKVHEIALHGLDKNKKYNVFLSVKDEEGNEARKQFAAFSTGVDSDPPTIIKLKIESALIKGVKDNKDKVQTIISWKTDEPATSRVSYYEGTEMEEGEFKEINKEDTTLTKDHAVVFTDFKTAMVYQIRVVSKDEQGNTAVSTNQTLVTPYRQKTVWEAIKQGGVDAFGWARGIKLIQIIRDVIKIQ